MGEWQPIETLPVGVRGLCWVPGHGLIVLERLPTPGFWWIEAICDEWVDEQPTHWMPLPAPPEAQR